MTQRKTPKEKGMKWIEEEALIPYELGHIEHAINIALRAQAKENDKERELWMSLIKAIWIGAMR